jgi:hypothetical protein
MHVTLKELDFFFPFLIFVYGLLTTFVLSSPQLMTIAEERLAPEMVNQFKTKRALGKFCLLLGGLWSLQNLWLT